MGTVVSYTGKADESVSVVILVDCSGSMEDTGQTGRRIDQAKAALRNIWAEVRGAKLIAFNSHVQTLETPEELPAPTGGTFLHLALDRALSMLPAQTIVISDGRPAEKERALDVARDMPGTIDVIFCGSEDDHEAIRFMEELGRVGAGKVIVKDLNKVASLANPLRELLGLPGK